MSVVPLGKHKTLKDVMPSEFLAGGYDNTKAFKMKDEIVLVEHGDMFDQVEKELSWPGSHKNVHYWVELTNGMAVGWNENPARGWSFPVVKNPYHAQMTVKEFEDLLAYYKEKYKGV